MARILQYIHRPNMTELGMGNTHDRYLVGPEDKLKLFFPLGVTTEVFDVYSKKKYSLYSKFENNEFRIKLMGDICDDYQMEPGDEVIFTRYESKEGTKTSLQIIECGRVFLNPGKRENGIIKDFEIVNIEKLPRFSKESKYTSKYSFLGEKHSVEIDFSETRRKRIDSPLLTDFYTVRYDGSFLESKNSPIYYLSIRNDGVILKSLQKCEFSILLNEGHEERKSGIQGPLQQIFYGAPGTGKSKTIKDTTEDAEKKGRVFRTTFHPDSDYSTFVGCYKPGMKSMDRIYSAEELAVKLKEIKNTGVTYPCHKFAAQYWRSIKDLDANSIKQILAAAGFTEAYGVEVSKGVAIGQEYLNKEEDGKIIYTFTPQAFTKAYIKAWNTEEDVYLIIEEINRGNCAQIFGDLFQLLDRGDDGKSEYPIYADTDLGNYIAKELESSIRTDFPDGVKEGKKLVLPSNLYIWATMNTSDQSLFPIDSAFKRRWDWEYVPIHDGGKGWQIEADGKLYDWWQFVDAMNNKIGAATYSEDKKLGYFFCKAKDGVIDAETFVGKVIFYVWNDVFKDFAEEAGNLFKDVDGSMLSFNKFYAIGTDGKRTVMESKITVLMQNLGVEAITSSISSSEEVVGDIEEELQNDIFGNQRKETLISISIPNNPTIKSSDSTQFDAFIKALRVIGFERIKSVASSLKYKRLGNIPVISTQRNEVIDNNNQGYSYYQEGGLFIIKGCKYYTYIRILEDLNGMLNIGLSMETK